MLTEKNIVESCKQYNKAAQMALYKRYAGKMNALCFRYVNSYEEAKDICQDGFIKVFASIHNYKGEGSLEGWIKRIMANTALDYLKKKKRHLFIPIDNIDFSEGNKSGSSYEEEQEEDALVAKLNFTNEQLMGMINQLPDIYRLVFNMHCIENYSHKEIADILSIQEETSRSRLRRARKILREHVMESIKASQISM